MMYRRNADKDLRVRERGTYSDPNDLSSLLRLQAARYRVGQTGVGRPKLEDWWQEAFIILTSISGGSPVHPNFLGKPNPHALHGEYRGYPVRIEQYFDQTRGPMQAVMYITVSDGRGWGEWPSGTKVKAWLLDSNTFVSAKHWENLWTEYTRNRFPIIHWDISEIEPNFYFTLSEMLDDMIEALFMHRHSHDLIDEADRECGNCGRDRSIQERLGHVFYHCQGCLGNLGTV